MKTLLTISTLVFTVIFSYPSFAKNKDSFFHMENPTLNLPEWCKKQESVIKGEVEGIHGTYEKFRFLHVQESCVRKQMKLCSISKNDPDRKKKVEGLLQWFEQKFVKKNADKVIWQNVGYCKKPTHQNLNIYFCGNREHYTKILDAIKHLKNELSETRKDKIHYLTESWQIKAYSALCK